MKGKPPSGKIDAGLGSRITNKYGNRHFWCRSYYADTVGRNKAAIAEYVRNQLQEDITADQISFQEFVVAFAKIIIGAKKHFLRTIEFVVNKIGGSI